MARHEWTYGEDFICCVIFIQTYIVNNRFLSLKCLAKESMPFLPKIPECSIKNKFRNILFIANERKITHSCTDSILKHKSDGNNSAFVDAYNCLITKINP